MNNAPISPKNKSANDCIDRSESEEFQIARRGALEKIAQCSTYVAPILLASISGQANAGS